MLNAGWDLDSLVASRVMGLEPWPHLPGYFRATTLLPRQTAKPCLPPPYSTDIGTAWTTVERLHKLLDCAVSVQRNMLGSKESWSIVPVYQATLWHSNNDGWTISAGADTAELAICRVALEAVP